MRFSHKLPILLQTFTIPVALSQYVPPNAKCTNYKIPVSVSTQISSFNATKWTNSFELQDFVSIGGSREDAGLPKALDGPAPFSGDFSISATFCTPADSKAGNAKKVLLATHGIGFNRGYWNSQYQPENYNFAQYFIGQGYSIFFYDRLGVDQSDKLSGFVNQIAIQIQILNQLSTFVKQGKYTGDLGAPDKLILVGHSFGSFQSNAVVALNPTAADGVVLTGYGFALNTRVLTESFNLHVAREQDPTKWGALDAGTLTWGDVYANVNNFFKQPYYTIDTVGFAEQNKQPFAITEFLTVNMANFNAPKFTGPVLVYNGEYDFIVCGGYCPGVNDQPARSYFPGSKAFSSYIQPGTGHGLNYHKNATAGYGVIANFLKQNGL